MRGLCRKSLACVPKVVLDEIGDWTAMVNLTSLRADLCPNAKAAVAFLTHVGVLSPPARCPRCGASSVAVTWAFRSCGCCVAVLQRRRSCGCCVAVLRRRGLRLQLSFVALFAPLHTEVRKRSGVWSRLGARCRTSGAPTQSRTRTPEGRSAA